MTMRLTEEQKLENKQRREALKLEKITIKDQPTTIRGGSTGGTTEGDQGSSGGAFKSPNGSSKGTNVKSGKSNLESGGSDKPSNGNSRESDRGSGGGSGGDHGNDREGSRGSDRTETDRTPDNQEKELSKQVNNGLKPLVIKPTVNKSHKKKDPPKKKGDLTDPETLSTLITSLSKSYASSTRRKYWEIEQDEALTLAEPASIVMQSLPKKQIEKINKAIAPISLIIAAGSIFIPRISLDIMYNKQRREAATNARKANTVHTRNIPEVQPGDDRQKESSDNVSSVLELDPTLTNILGKIDS